MDADSHIVDANEAAVAEYGYPRQELLGMSIRELRAVSELVTFQRQWEKVRKQKEIHFESWHRRRNGTLFPVEVHSRLVETDRGQYFKSVIVDISEKKIDRTRERRLINIYRSLSETNEAIIHGQSEIELFSSLCRIAVEYGGMVLAWVGIVDSGKKYALATSYGKDDGFLDEFPLFSEKEAEGGCPACIGFSESRHIVANDISKDQLSGPCRERAERYAIRSASTYPILRNGNQYAVFSVHSDQVGAFDDEIVQLLDEMAKNVSFALDNLDREDERKKAQEELQLTQYSLEIAVDPVFWVRPDGSMHFVNKAACQYLGYSREEMLNLTIMDIDPQITADIWLRIWEEEKLYQSRKFETQHRAKDGREIPVEITTNCVEYNGREYRFAFVRDISERKKSEELIWRQANFDALTGLPNRYLLLERLAQEIGKSQRSSLPLALMFIDLDYFKDVNDTLGHSTGDLLLKQAAQRINDCVRKTDTVARLSGDEFTVILADLSDANSVERTARNILEKLSEPFMLDGEAAYVSASVGITFYPGDANDSESLLKNADQAMYAAKCQGRNRYSYYDASLQEAADARRQLIKYLHAALDHGQFHVVYQPIVELATGHIHKAEALIRWHHPERGLISPAEFIPLAEQTGLIVEIGDWVFRQAARMVKHVRERLHPDFQISINKSPAQFRNDRSWYKTWFDYLHKQGLPGKSIVIEITESLLMDSAGLVADKLNAFRGSGMQISLDDFGTGYSSLSYLQKFELDYLKIDQSFVRNLKADSSDMALCEAIVVMAHKLGIKVIAEGVETEEQRGLLLKAGCDYAQGYLFSRPVASMELENLLLADAHIERG